RLRRRRPLIGPAAAWRRLPGLPCRRRLPLPLRPPPAPRRLHDLRLPHLPRRHRRGPAHGRAGAKGAPPHIGGDDMKLDCDTRSLSRALAIAGRCVARTTSLPILSHVLLQAAEGRLTLTATDL